MPIGLDVSVPSVAFTYDKKQLRKTLRTAGAEVAQVTRAMLRNGKGTGKTYRGPGGSAKPYRGGAKPGHYTASSAGEAPVRVTGTLARSIKVRPFPSGEGVAVRAAAFYALFLQAGAKGGGRMNRDGRKIRGKGGTATGRVLEPRPFLSAALASRIGSLQVRIEQSVRQDIAFVKMR